MRKVIDITGQKFGRLTAIERTGSNKSNHAVWLFECECGNFKNIVGKSVTKGKTQSCGCYNIEKIKQRTTTHGMTKNHPLYGVWRSMIDRCYLEKATGFENWGGRGITVCEEWRNDFRVFYDWAMANGWQKDLSIDRIDNNGNYTPENCRFATRKTQNNNQRQRIDVIAIEYNGHKRTLKDWCRIFELKYTTIRQRLNLGWSVEKALETPVIKK